MSSTTDSAIDRAAGPRVYGQFIDGAMTDPSERLIDRRAPGTGKLIARYSDGSIDDMERAITAARGAFDHGEWPHLSGMDRGRALLRLAEAMRDNKALLAEIEAEEVGKAIRMARGDVDGSVGLVEFAAALAMAMHGDAHTNAKLSRPQGQRAGLVLSLAHRRSDDAPP